MRKVMICLALVASTALGGCFTGTPPPESGGSAAVTPLGDTMVDERAIRFSFSALATVSSAADLLLKTGVIKPKSPRALALADALETAKNGLNAASAAQRAGNAATATEAWSNAEKALREARKALGIQ